MPGGEELRGWCKVRGNFIRKGAHIHVHSCAANVVSAGFTPHKDPLRLFAALICSLESTRTNLTMV